MVGRSSLDAARVRAHIVRDGGLWHSVRTLEQTSSTNADVAAFARRAEPEGLVTVAEFQTSGRGRFDRQWVSPPRSGLTFSMLLRPVDVTADRWGWLPLLMAAAVATALAEATQVVMALKWPNDLLFGMERKKGGGLLSEVADGAVVVGVGINVTTTEDELPIPAATSLELEGAWTVDREVLLGHILNQVERDYVQWRSVGGDASVSGLQERYRDLCATLGRRVKVTLPGGERLEGTASDITGGGGLVVATADGLVTVAAGDVAHLR